MLLDPPYQRGDVWGTTRRQNLIKSILMGVPIPSIVINDRSKSGWDFDLTCVVIDGKQRVTSILMFLNDELTVEGSWFGLPEGQIKFSELPLPQQRRFKQHTLQFCEGQLETIEHETEVFELINYGGVPQGETD